MKKKRGEKLKQIIYFGKLEKSVFGSSTLHFLIVDQLFDRYQPYRMQPSKQGTMGRITNLAKLLKLDSNLARVLQAKWKQHAQVEVALEIASDQTVPDKGDL